MKTKFAPVPKNAEARRTQRLAEKEINDLLRVSPRPRRLGVKLPLAALLLCVLALTPSASHAQTNDLTKLLQQGLFEEQANRNLDAAIADYQSLAAQFDKDRQLAATAIFRLGECYRAQGKTNEAAAQYQRILRDFSDEQTLATLSRQNLTGMGMSAPSSATTASANGIAQQKQLLNDEIKLVEQQLASQQAQVKVGVLPSDGVLPTQQKLLELKRQLATLDSNRADLVDLSVSATSEEDQEIQRIQQMIQNSPDLINAPGEGGNTPLMEAAYKGWLKVATYLIEHGADVNAGGIPPLNRAATVGNRAMTELLLSRGANVNSKGSQGKTSLHTALEKKFPAVAEALLANKADINAQDDFGNTPLVPAAEKQQVKMVQSLLVAGANPNLENKHGQIPFSVAAASGSPEIVKLFLAAKADPNGGKMEAPLLAAIHAKDAAAVELLLQAGANPNVKGQVHWQDYSSGYHYEDGFGCGWATPLWLATSMGQLPMVRLLLKFKANPNDFQTDGRPLIFSALPHLDILAALLDAGADPNQPNNNVPNSPVWQGESPLMSAVGNSYYETSEGNLAAAKLLLAHGANPNAKDRNNDTALHWAVGLDGLEGWTIGPAERELVRLLLDYHLDPNLRNNDGKTPLDLLKDKIAQNSFRAYSPETVAKQKTFAKDLADLLRQHGALDILPDWDRITMSRPSAKFSDVIFRKGTNDWNQFTMFDLLGVQYELLTASPGRVTRVQVAHYGVGGGRVENSLSFPDFTRIIIHRPSARGTNWNELKINLARALNSGDCAGDVPLQFGDMVEIPEADHVLNESWRGLSTNELFRLKNCLTRQLQITVNGQTTNINVAPQVEMIMPGTAGYVHYVPFSGAGGTEEEPEISLLKFEPVMLWPVLENSKLLLASSDLSRVIVKRRDVATGRTREWTVDCSNPNSPPAFWLRDGDVIEVPGK